MTEATLQLPPKLLPVFSGEARFRGAYGGRGSGKTRTFALMSAVTGYRVGMSGKTGQILCGREFMNSLEDSSLEEVRLAIKSVPWLDNYYECGAKFIRSRDGKINYVFSGLRHSLDSLKSKANLILAWVDEAEAVSDEAWRKLIPTVREHDSEIWITWNPENKNSATHQRFRASQDDDMKIVEMNWRDNPWFPKVLEIERRRDQAQRPETYEHVWEGGFLDYIEGAYFKDQLKTARDEGRITNLPKIESSPCWTCWDIGNSDGTAIWVVQKVGQEYRVVDFYESWGKPYAHAVRWLKEKEYIFDMMLLPHDAGHTRQGQSENRSPQQMLQELMPQTEWVIVPRIKELTWGIQQARDLFPMLWFDKKKCEAGLEHLVGYSRKWSTNEKRWLNAPDKSTGHSEAADALRQLAQAYFAGLLDQVSSWGEPIRRNLQGVA